MKETVYYAIGDIHGELSKLRALHDNISAFHEKKYVNRPHTRIHLGDYVDRGPDRILSKPCQTMRHSAQLI